MVIMHAIVLCEYTSQLHACHAGTEWMECKEFEHINSFSEGATSSHNEISTWPQYQSTSGDAMHSSIALPHGPHNTQ